MVIINNKVGFILLHYYTVFFQTLPWQSKRPFFFVLVKQLISNYSLVTIQITRVSFSIFQKISKNLRSPKWLSTSVPESQWGEDHGKYASLDYFMDNAKVRVRVGLL